MNSRIKILLLAAVFSTALAGIFVNGQVASAGGGGSQKGTHKIGFTDEFFLEDCTWSNTGSNRYFILEPNYQQAYRGEEKDGTEVELIITVLEETEVVDGVETRVLEERESQDDILIEVSRNFLAICEQTNSIIYFGEDVDFYDENGNIIGHEGEWRAGEGDNEAGMFMPSVALLGAKYLQEIAPDTAMDQALIVSIDEEVETPAGDFEDVVKIKETTPLEPGAVEFKFHAAGVGLIQDAELKLEEYGFIS